MSIFPRSDTTKEDPDFPITDWMDDVAGGNTRKGYVEWARYERESADEAALQVALAEKLKGFDVAAAAAEGWLITEDDAEGGTLYFAWIDEAAARARRGAIRDAELHVLAEATKGSLLHLAALDIVHPEAREFTVTTTEKEKRKMEVSVVARSPLHAWQLAVQKWYDTDIDDKECFDWSLGGEVDSVDGEDCDVTFNDGDAITDVTWKEEELP